MKASTTTIEEKQSAMTPIIGFRTTRRDAPKAIRTPVLITGAAEATGTSLTAPSQTADYIYRIAALTAGLALLATVV